MAKVIGYLQIALAGTKSFTKELLAQLNDRIKNITISSILFLLLSALAYFWLCYLVSGFSERPCSTRRIIKNYLLIFVRTILWIAFSVTLGTIYYTIVETTLPHGIIVRSLCYILFGLTVYYGALFSIPPNYL